LSRARLLGAVAAAALLAVPAAGASPRFELRQVDVGAYPMIRLVVHSADPSNAPRIYENGKPVSGLSYHNLGASKAIVLAIDRSKSMTGEPLSRAGAAADQLLRRKRQSDQVEVVTFGSTALAQTTFSQSTIDGDTALSTLSPDTKEGTALYDAIVVAAANLNAQTLPGRVLVLLTDGHDVRSLATFDEALQAARKANVVVYTIALGDAATGPLRRLARETGGSFYSSTTPAALASIYRRISAELDHIWRVSYTTVARPGDQLAITVGSRSGPGKSLELPGPKSTPYRPLIPSALLRSTGGVLLLMLVVAVLFFLALVKARSLPRAERIRRLVRDHTDRQRETRRREKRQRLTIAGVVAALNHRLRGLPQLNRLERLVETAGIPATASTVLAGSVCLALVLSLFAALTASAGIVIVFFFVLGLVGPVIGVRILARRRVHAFEEQLPDVLATIASSLKVGHGLKAALQTVAAEGAPPMSVELRRVLSEARLGRPLEEALVNMCERLGSDDLIYVATAVDVQSQVGGSLAGVFNTVAETVRERQQHRRRVRAVTSTGRATAVVLSLMPLAFLGILLLLSPSYVTPFLSSGIGHVLMVASAISISIGAFLLNRIVSIKV
jgi:tight adherence protein B